MGQNENIEDNNNSLAKAKLTESFNEFTREFIVPFRGAIKWCHINLTGPEKKIGILNSLAFMPEKYAENKLNKDRLGNIIELIMGH